MGKGAGRHRGLWQKRKGALTPPRQCADCALFYNGLANCFTSSAERLPRSYCANPPAYEPKQDASEERGYRANQSPPSP